MSTHPLNRRRGDSSVSKRRKVLERVALVTLLGAVGYWVGPPGVPFVEFLKANLLPPLPVISPE